MGWTDVPYDIPNFRAECGPAEAKVRIGWLRSVWLTFRTLFAVQSFTDELAAASKRDRVEYLLDMIGSPRTIDTRPPDRRKKSRPLYTRHRAPPPGN